MMLRLLKLIAQRASDHDGLSARDRQALSKEFGHTPKARTTVKRVLEIFGHDLFVDSSERRMLINLLNLDDNGRAELDGLIEADGMGLVRRRFAREPGTAYALLRDRLAAAPVRMEAARALARSNDPHALKALDEAFKKAHGWSARFAIARLLIKKDSRLCRRDDIIKAHVAAALKGSKEIKAKSLSLLKRLNDKRAVRAFVAELTNADPIIRRGAIDFLAHHDDDTARASIIATLKDPDRDVRAAAIRYLAKVQDPKAYMPLIEALTKAHANKRYAEHHALDAAIKQYSANPRVRLAFNRRIATHADPAVRYASIKRLAKERDPRHIPIFVDALKDKRAQVRLAAARALADLKDKRVIDALKEAMNDVDESIRFCAITRLKKVSDARLIPVFSKALHDPFDMIYNAAVAGLKNVNDRHDNDLLSALNKALNSTNRKVRLRVMVTLFKMGPAATPILIKALSSGKTFVRENAADILGEIGPAAKSAIPALIKALSDDNKNVRASAAWALSKIGPSAKSAVSALAKALGDSNYLVRAGAAGALGKAGPAAVPTLIKLLGADDPNVRVGAAYALGRIGPSAKAAVPALIKMIGVSDWIGRATIATALSRIDPASKAGIPALKQKQL